LAVNLTAGNSSGVTVSDIKLKKEGVLADNSVSGAYLVENGKVLAQYSSLNSGVLTFNGLALSIAAGQTRTLILAIDPATGLSAGNTVSFSLNAATDVTATDAANAVVTPSGSFPLRGNVFTVTTVSSPNIATISISSSSIGTTVYAGTQNVIVSQWTTSISNSAVNLSSINFKVTGSANKTDIRNVKLFVNGTQVGNTLPQVAADGSAYFDLSQGSTTARLNTGTSNMQIRADVMGSPSFTFKFQLLNSYDVYAIDTQYNVPVSPTINGGSGVEVTINQGALTLSLASDTPTGNISAGGSATALAKFTIYAAGEALKVKFLNFGLEITGGSASLDSNIKNLALVDDAGGQVGSTINSLATTASCTNDVNSSGFSAATSSPNNCFGSNSSPINYIVPANTTRVLTLRGDIQTTADFTSIVASLTGEATANLQGLTSSQTSASTGVNGRSLSLVTSGLTVQQNSSIGTQTFAAGSNGVVIGSYSLKASTAEGVNLNTINITTGANGASYRNMKLMVGSTQVGSTQPSLAASTAYGFSGSLHIDKGQSVTLSVVGDILSTASGNHTTVTTLSSFSGTGDTTYSNLTSTSTAGQNIVIAGGSTITVTIDASSPQSAQVVAGTNNVPLATFRINETSNVEDVKITDLYVFEQVEATSTVKSTFNNLGIFVGSETTARGTSQNATAAASSSNPGAGYYHKFTFTSPLIVPKNGALLIALKGDVGSFSNSGVTDNATFVFKIATSTDSVNNTVAETVVALGNTSNVAATTTLSSATANAVTVLRNKLTASATALGGSSHNKNAQDQLGTIAFAADSSGSGGAVLNTVTVTFGGTAPSIATFLDGVTLRYGGTDVTTAGTLAGVTVTSATSSQQCTGGVGAGPTCTKTWNFGTTNTGLTVSPGTTISFVLQVDSTKTLAASSGVSQSLSAQIVSNGHVMFTTAPDSAGASPISLQTNAVPININSVSYPAGQ
jgi:hypothetical protein